MYPSKIVKCGTVAILTAALFFVTPFSSAAGVIEAELEELLLSLAPHEEVPVIVTFSDRVHTPGFVEKNKSLRRAKLIRALKRKAEQAQGPVKTLAEARGARHLRQLWIVNGLALTARPGLIQAMAKRPGVDRIQLDRKLEAPVSTMDAPGPVEWNIEKIGAPELWNMGYTGAGVVVAAMDTGVDANHPDLADRWRGGTNSWFDPYGEHENPYDKLGHGTQVTGIMVGGSSGGTAIGVAPDAVWIAVKIFNDSGQAAYSAIHEGFQWLLDPDGNPLNDDAPDVVNNSWGFDQNPDQCIAEFREDIQVLRTADIAVVFSAGNTGPSDYSSVSPANDSESFAAGAVDAGGNIDLASGRGPSACDGSIYPELSAPGVSVRTADLTFGGAVPDSYAYVSGTSFASPHVAGAMALLLSAAPWATVYELESGLKASASDLGTPGPDNVYGYGFLNAAEAYHFLETPLPCTDGDGDGYYSEPGCGTSVDCNDQDEGSYPGAPEIKHDGIDQDCNGYDLTIDVVKAEYLGKKDVLEVEATSALGGNAALELAGYGAMKWNRKSSSWTLSARKIGGNPGQVTVMGLEGWEKAMILSK